MPALLESDRETQTPELEEQLALTVTRVEPRVGTYVPDVPVRASERQRGSSHGEHNFLCAAARLTSPLGRLKIMALSFPSDFPEKLSLIHFHVQTEIAIFRDYFSSLTVTAPFSLQVIFAP